MANVEVVHEENGDLVCYATNSPSYEEITIEDENDDTEILKLRIHTNEEEQQHFNFYVQNLDCGSQPKGFVPVSFITEPFLPVSSQAVTPVTPRSNELQTTVDKEATCASSQCVSNEKKDILNVTGDDTKKDISKQNLDEKKYTIKQNCDKKRKDIKNQNPDEKVNKQSGDEMIIKKVKKGKIFVKENNCENVEHFETKGIEKLLNMKKEIEVVDKIKKESLKVASSHDKSLITKHATPDATTPLTSDATRKFKLGERKVLKKGLSPLFKSKSSPEIVIKKEITSDDDTKPEVKTAKSTPSLVKLYNAQLPIIKIEKMDLEKVKRSLIFHEKSAAAAAAAVAKTAQTLIKKKPIKKPRTSSKGQIKSVSKRKTNFEDIENTAEHMFHKHIPPGWKRVVRERQEGATAGKYDVYVYAPCGKKLRSGVEVGKYLEDNNITNINRTDFEFGVKSQSRKFKRTKTQPENAKKQKLIPTGKSKLKTAYCPIDYDNPIPSTSGIKFPKAKQIVTTNLHKNKSVIDYDNPVPSTSGLKFKLKKSKSSVDSEPVKKKQKVGWKIKFQPSTKIHSEPDDYFGPRKRGKSKSMTPSPKQKDYSSILQRHKNLLKGKSVSINLVKCDFSNKCQDHRKRLLSKSLQPSAVFCAPKSLKMLATLESLPKLPATSQSNEEISSLSPMSSSPTENLLFFEQDLPCCEPSSDILRSLELIRCPQSLSDAVKLCEVESEGSSPSVNSDNIQDTGHTRDLTNVSSECDGLWVPPKSPFNIIYEYLYSEPWKLLIATIIMRNCAAPVGTTLVWHFFEQYPTFESLQKANPAELHKFLQHSLSPHKCAKKIVKFIEEFDAKPWMYPYELTSIGKYGGDAYRIFCVKEWRDVHPNDFDLCIYHNWLSQNHQKLNV